MIGQTKITQVRIQSLKQIRLTSKQKLVLCLPKLYCKMQMEKKNKKRKKKIKKKESLKW